MNTARKPALGFIFIVLFLDVLGLGLIIPIIPQLVKDLLPGSSVAGASYMYGLLIGLYSLMQFLFAPVLGSLSDRFGRRPIILISVCGAALDYFLLAWAPTLAWFVLGRLISGITAANFSAANAYIADISPPEKRSANFGISGAAFGLGFVFGPALGGWVADEFGLRAPFYLAGILTLLNWFYGLLVLPESLKPENRRPFSWTRANPIGALLDLRKHPLVAGLSGSFFLTNLAHQVFPAIWVLYTSHRYDWGYKQTGLSLALVGLMAALVQGVLNRKIIPWMGERRAAGVGMGISACALIAYGLADQGWLMYVIIMIGSLGGISAPAVQGMISRTVGDDEQGAIGGSLTSLYSVTGALGPPLFAGLFGFFISEKSRFYLPGAGFYFSAFLIFLGLGVAIFSFHKIKHQSQI